MRSRASLALMEQLIMILVFALAAAICLQAFVKAEAISLETQRRDEAMVLAQNVAEVLRGTGGNFAQAENLAQDAYHVEIEKKDTGIPEFGKAEIFVYYEERLLISLEVGWQEVVP